jgi:hypothetical protein
VVGAGILTAPPGRSLTPIERALPITEDLKHVVDDI